MNEGSARYEVNIEGQIHPWDKETISVPEIRELGGFQADSPVVGVNIEDNSEERLSEDAVHNLVPLEEGKPLVKRMSFKRPGRYEVNIEGRIHPWIKDTISVPEIRQLGGFAPDSPVVAVNIEDNTEDRLADDEVHNVVALKEGKPLVKRKSFKRA
jgi:hypothetical protein